MRFRLAAALAAGACITAAAAQPIETVVVTGSEVAGIWKITHPNFVAKAGFFAPMKWGPMQDAYCRLEQTNADLASHCLGMPDLGAAGTVTIDSGHIHLAWGTMMARVVVDGRLQSPTQFDGTFTFKLSGISFDDPDHSLGVKQVVSQATPDKGGKAALLRTILTGGLAAVPHDDAAMKKSPFRDTDIPHLGAVQAIAWLGAMNKPDNGPEVTDLDFLSVYAIEFDSGERICGLHQRPDGVLDAFRCA